MGFSMIKEKDTLTDCWGDSWKVLGVEDDAVYIECVASLLTPEVIGEGDVILLTDIYVE